MDLTYILIGVAVVAVVFVLLALVGSKKAAQSAPPPPAQSLPHAPQSPTVAATPPACSPQAHTQPAQRMPVEVQQTPVESAEDAKFDEFVKLINHEREKAQRQIARLERNYPGKSRLWCIEKAIEDVLRDRHAR